MNKNKITKVVSGAMLLAVGGFAVTSLTGCTDKSVDNLYDALKSIANDVYKETKGINDSTDYIKGLSALLMEENNGVYDIDYCAYTEDLGIHCLFKVTAESEKKCVSTINDNYSTKGYFKPQTLVGNLNNDENIKEKYLTKMGFNNESVDARNRGVDPIKYMAFNKDENTVYISSTCKNGVGNYISLIGKEYDILRDNFEKGRSDEVKQERMQYAYDIISSYILG